MSDYRDQNVLRKASSVITANQKGDVVLEPQDRILMNYLLWRAWNDLTPHGVYLIPTKDVMDYTRIKRHKDLQAAIERLCKVVLEIDYMDDSGDARYILAHYLSMDMSRSENGMMRYAFDSILYHFIADPKVYANIYIDRGRDMKTAAAMALYEIMALQYRKKSPIWRTTPEQLRSLLKVGDKHPRPDNFRKNVIEKAVEEVNAIAEFEVQVDYVKGGQGGGIVEIEFKALSKSHARLVEAASTKLVSANRGSGKKDTHTIDMLDGMTHEERGGPATLTDVAIEAARELMPADGNIDDYVAEWRSANKGKVFNDPDAAFTAWMQVRIEKDNDPLLKDLDSDVFGSLIGE